MGYRRLWYLTHIELTDNLQRLTSVLLGRKLMQGINFVVNDHQEHIAVIIDLKQYGELWEDFYDCLIAFERQTEPRESLTEVRQRLLQQGKLTAHD